MSPRLSSETCYSDLCSCSPPLFPSLSFKRSLCRFFTLCPPICLQKPVNQISILALLLSSPLSLSRDSYLGSLLSVPCLSTETCYSDLCSCSPHLFPSLTFERSLCRFFTLCPPVFLQRPVTQISVLALLLSSPLSLLRDPYVGSLLSVLPSVFRDLLLRSLLLLFSCLPLPLFQEIPM